MKSKHLFIYCDGGARGNPGPAAGAFVAKNQEEKILHQTGKYLGEKTNNEAEYNGVILALDWLISQKGKLNGFELTFYLDSKLVVNQLNGYFKIKNSRLRELIARIKILEPQVKANIFYKFIPREQNQLADQLVNLALDMKKAVKTT